MNHTKIGSTNLNQDKTMFFPKHRKETRKMRNNFSFLPLHTHRHTKSKSLHIRFTIYPELLLFAFFPLFSLISFCTSNLRFQSKFRFSNSFFFANIEFEYNVVYMNFICFCLFLTHTF